MWTPLDCSDPGRPVDLHSRQNRMNRLGNPLPVEDLGPAAIGRPDLNQAGKTVEVGRQVVARRTQSRRVEEQYIALGKRQLDMVFIELRAEIGDASAAAGKPAIIFAFP